jgi:hypothetical protein
MTNTFKPGDRVRVKAIWPFGGRRGQVVHADELYVHVRIRRSKQKASHVLYRADELEKVEDANAERPNVQS